MSAPRTTSGWATVFTSFTLVILSSCGGARDTSTHPQAREYEYVKRWKSTGALMERGTLRAGKRVGAWAFYDRDENLLQAGRYKEGELHGTWRDWYPYAPGQRRSLEQYQNGLLHGVRKHWDKKGHLRLRTEYRNGRRHGVSERWDKRGRSHVREKYRNGRLDGLQEIFSSSGDLTSRVNFRDGRRHGPYQRQEYGQTTKGSFRAGLRQGASTTRDSLTGALVAQENWEVGELHGKRTTYWRTGKPRLVEHYLGGKPNGEFQRFDEQGSLKVHGYYASGEKTGRWTLYFSGTQMPSAINNYSHDVLSGTQEYFRESPHSLFQRVLIKDQELIEEVTFDENGTEIGRINRRL